MKNTNNELPVKDGIASVISVALLGISINFFLSNYQFSFNANTSINYQYNLVLVLPVLSVLLIAWSLRINQSYTLFQAICLIITFISMLLVIFSDHYSFGNEHFFVVTIIGIIGSSGLFLQNSARIVHLGIFLFLSFFLYELYIGLIQWLSIDATYEKADRLVCGSLHNSGIFGCYLVLNIPFLYWLFFLINIESTSNNRILYFIGEKRQFYFLRVLFFAAIISLVGFLIFEIKSRTAITAFAIMLSGRLIMQFNSNFCRILRSRPKTVVVICLLLSMSAISAISYYLFSIKKMSTSGRLLMLHIAWDHITDNFWFGTGLGRYSWYYPKWQAEYFITHPTPPKAFFLSAGESYGIFNEYFQMLEEVGLLGFVFFVALVIYLFKLKSYKQASLLNTIKYSTATLLFYGFTSYPFHVNIFLLLFAFCFSSALILRGANGYSKQKHLITRLSSVRIGSIAFLLIFVAWALYKGLNEYWAIKKWEILKGDYSLHFNENTQKSLSLYHTLQSNGKFLTELGDILSTDTTKAKNAAAMLEEAKLYFLSRKTVEATANAYMQAGNYSKAIENYEWLNNYLPNLFMPKYELLKAYQRKNDLKNVETIARKIISMPIKIPSAEVNQIKEEALKALNDID